MELIDAQTEPQGLLHDAKRREEAGVSQDQSPQNDCLVYHRSYYNLFVDHVERSSSSVWGEGRGPAFELKDRFTWLSPDRWGQDGQATKAAQGGLGADLLTAMCFFPPSEEKFRVTSRLLQAYFIDDWLEKQTPAVVAEFEGWWGRLLRQWNATADFDQKWARQKWPASYDADPTLSTGVAELFCSSLGVLCEIAGKADPAGFGRLLRESQLYAKGVVLEVEHAARYRTTGQMPGVAEYLSYRGFCSAASVMFVLAALGRGIRLSEERFEQAGVLLDTASLCVACFNDAFAPDKDAQEGLLNLASIVGHRRAVDIHNMLVDWLEEEAEAWVNGAAKCDRDASLKFVDLIKASTFGIALWQSACPRYIQVAGQFEPVGILDGQPKRLSSQDAELKHHLKHMMCNRAGKELASWLRCI